MLLKYAKDKDIKIPRSNTKEFDLYIGQGSKAAFGLSIGYYKSREIKVLLDEYHQSAIEDQNSSLNELLDFFEPKNNDMAWVLSTDW